MGNIITNIIPFSTNSLSNCKLWIKANGINQPIGSVINFCKDYSRFNNDLTNFTSMAPTLTLDAKNLLPAIKFSGNSGQQLTTVNNLNFTALTCTFVAQAAISGTYTIIGMVFGGCEICLGILSSPAIYFIQQSQAGIGSYNASLFQNKPYLVTITYTNSGAYVFYLNGNTVLTGTNAVTFQPNSLKLGGGGGNSPINGDIQELFFFDQALPRGETEKIEQYLNRKYSIF